MAHSIPKQMSDNCRGQKQTIYAYQHRLYSVIVALLFYISTSPLQTMNFIHFPFAWTVFRCPRQLPNTCTYGQTKTLLPVLHSFAYTHTLTGMVYTTWLRKCPTACNVTTRLEIVRIPTCTCTSMCATASYLCKYNCC